MTIFQYSKEAGNLIFGQIHNNQVRYRLHERLRTYRFMIDFNEWCKAGATTGFILKLEY
jgi:hypothetical protein